MECSVTAGVEKQGHTVAVAEVLHFTDEQRVIPSLVAVHDPTPYLGESAWHEGVRSAPGEVDGQTRLCSTTEITRHDEVHRCTPHKIICRCVYGHQENFKPRSTAACEA